MVINEEDKDMEMFDLEIDNDNSMNDTESESDADDCDEIQLRTSFSKTYSFSVEKALSLIKNYILHISCTTETAPKICVGLSNNTCEIYSLANNQITKNTTLNNSNNIINVKFNSDNTLFTGTSKNIKLWDLRTPTKPTAEFKDNSDESEDKSFLHFDVSPNNRLLCASTELHENDAYLLFWDIRKRNLLGGYWESHTDDITKIAFHHSNNNKLASGSTDGLVNIYNLNETNEEDALLNTLNSDSSIEQILWYNTGSTDNICCVTHTAEVQLWDVEEANPYKKFNRTDITKALLRKSPDHCYVANVHTNKYENIFLLAGSNWNKGECVRGIDIQNNSKLTPNFKLNNNKQRIRASWFNKESELLITGGEQCILNIWKETMEEDRKVDLKTKGKIKNCVVKPY